MLSLNATTLSKQRERSKQEQQAKKQNFFLSKCPREQEVVFPPFPITLKYSFSRTLLPTTDYTKRSDNLSFYREVIIQKEAFKYQKRKHNVILG
jgi:hypothetical protein